MIQSQLPEMKEMTEISQEISQEIITTETTTETTETTEIAETTGTTDRHHNAMIAVKNQDVHQIQMKLKIECPN